MSNAETTLVQRETHAPEAAGSLWAELLTLAAFCAFLFYFGLGSFGLVGADEPRYAQIAREMLARHDWITPVLNGVPWLEKPVLYYWGAMLSYSVFGVSDWAARVPSAVLATAMVAAIYFFMRPFATATPAKAARDGGPARSGAQLDAALITASAAATIGFARAASMDMPLAATFTIGMLAWYRWRESKRNRWLAAFYVFLGLATLAKGPVAPLLAAAIIVIFAALRREPRLILRTLWWPALLLFFVVAAPWYVAVQWRNPEFFRTFFLEHNFARFSQDVFHHRQPFWYYLPVLLLSVAPWTVYAVVAFCSAAVPAAVAEGIPPSARVREARTRTADDHPRTHKGTAFWRPRCETAALRWFLIIWLLVPVVLFSFSQSKLPGYILPSVPAFALLLADYLCAARARNAKPSLAVVALHAAVGALLLGAVLLMQYFVLRTPAPRQARVVAGAVAAVVFAGMALTVRARGLRLLRFVTLVPVILGLAFIVRAGSPAVDQALSARPVALELQRVNAARMEVAVFKAKREVEYGLNFYLDHAIPRYERREIPAVQHLVVAPAGSQGELQALVSGRRVSRIGEFAQQRLEFFWVSAPGASHHQHPPGG